VEAPGARHSWGFLLFGAASWLEDPSAGRRAGTKRPETGSRTHDCSASPSVTTLTETRAAARRSRGFRRLPTYAVRSPPRPVTRGAVAGLIDFDCIRVTSLRT
jgi:hypothetical protein